MTMMQPEAEGQAPGHRALFGWSPPDLPADTTLKRRADRLLPRTGIPGVLAASLLFECGWSMARGTNSLGRGTGTTARGPGAAGCGPGAAGCGTGAFPGR